MAAKDAPGPILPFDNPTDDRLSQWLTRK